MRICSFCELKNKEVISVCDGRRLGYVTDIEIDLDCGRVVAITVAMACKVLSLSKCDHIRVLWCDIDKIGDDVILVRESEHILSNSTNRKQCKC